VEAESVTPAANPRPDRLLPPASGHGRITSLRVRTVGPHVLASPWLDLDTDVTSYGRAVKNHLGFGNPHLGPLAKPATIAGLELPNRLVMAPMTRAMSPGGVPSEDVAAYYERRAGSGIGLIITEGIYVDHPSAGHEPDVPRLVPDESAEGWRRVVARIHDAGGRVAAQLWHLGSEREAVDGVPAWTPSGVREDGSPRGWAMTHDDMREVSDAFARSAARAREVGFDAVELHGAHGYLLDEFLWSATNRRMDEYGGVAGSRAAFPAAVVAAVREAVGPDYPIIYRFSQFKNRAYGAQVATSPDELGSLLGPLVAAGIDMLHASTRRFWEPAFPGSTLSLAGWAKTLTGLPTITVGSVGLAEGFLTDPHAPGSLKSLCERFERGEFELVAVGRGLLANPDWAHKIRLGGRPVPFSEEHVARLY